METHIRKIIHAHGERLEESGIKGDPTGPLGEKPMRAGRIYQRRRRGPDMQADAQKTAKIRLLLDWRRRDKDSEKGRLWSWIGSNWNLIWIEWSWTVVVSWSVADLLRQVGS